MTPESRALTVNAWLATLTQRDRYREALCAALDQLHLAQRTIDRKDEQIADLREEIARYGRSVFGVEAP